MSHNEILDKMVGLNSPKKTASESNQETLNKVEETLRELDPESRMQVIASALVYELRIQFGSEALPKFKRLALNINEQLEK